MKIKKLKALKRHEAALIAAHTAFIMLVVMFLFPHNLSPTGFWMASAKGSSMLPTFDESTLVLCYTPLDGALGVGDVVIAQIPGRYYNPETGQSVPTMAAVCHRLIWRNETHVQTRGDGNSQSDQVVPIGNVLGKVYFHARLGVAVAAILLVVAAGAIEAAVFLVLHLKRRGAGK